MASGQKFKVQGKSITQLLDLSDKQINKMTAEELRPVVMRLNSASNKRLKRLEQKAPESPAYRQVMENQGKFSVKGIGKTDRNKLLAEYSRNKTFLIDKTSTLKGLAQFKKEFEELSGIKYDEFFDERANWELLSRLREKDPSFNAHEGRYIQYGDIMDIVNESKDGGKMFTLSNGETVNVKITYNKSGKLRKTSLDNLWKVLADRYGIQYEEKEKQASQLFGDDNFTNIKGDEI